MKCKRCGRCCIATDHVDVYDKDYKKWKGTFLASDGMVNEFDCFGSDPEFRRALEKHLREVGGVKGFKMVEDRCPFFHQLSNGKAVCLIEGAKPSMCMGFQPGSKHAKKFCQCPA